ncbi:MAG: nucleotide exchange factor GrpE, partial [Thermodesulfobacteriota bacterium]|nr:nucleotide exchange factor GrpE [Thermodesulfobacteriota bacterium]
MSEGIRTEEATHEEKGKQSSSRAKPAPKKELLAKLEETEKSASENHDKYLRACAELENYKKRAAKDRENFIKYGNETLIKDMLPTVDSM